MLYLNALHLAREGRLYTVTYQLHGENGVTRSTTYHFLHPSLGVSRLTSGGLDHDKYFAGPVSHPIVAIFPYS